MLFVQENGKGYPARSAHPVLSTSRRNERAYARRKLEPVGRRVFSGQKLAESSHRIVIAKIAWTFDI